MARVSKSMSMKPDTSSDLKLLIRSQLLTQPRRRPAGVDLAGKVAIITGASTGLGLHTSRHFLTMCLSHLIMAGRSIQRGEAAAAKLRADFPKARIDVWELEMASYPSIQAFARRIETDLPRLDIAILNVGIFGWEYRVCEETGHEEVIQVNFLGTFLLAILMMPLLHAKVPKGQGPGRLTIIGSGVALMAKLRNKDQRPLLASFDTPKGYDGPERYYDSKLLGHLLFARMYEYLPDPSEVIVNISDPGLCKGSELHRTIGGFPGKAFTLLKAILGRTQDDGAWAHVDAAVVQGAESHGSFVMDWVVKPFATMLYRPGAQKLMDDLWEETMAELQFAGALDIIRSLKASDLHGE